VYHSDYSECAQCKANRERVAAKARELSMETRAPIKWIPKGAQGKKKRPVQSSIGMADQVTPGAVGGKRLAGDREGCHRLERPRTGEDR